MNQIRGTPNNKGHTRPLQYLQKATMLLFSFVLCLVFFLYDASLVLAADPLQANEVPSERVVPDEANALVDDIEEASTSTPAADTETAPEESFETTEPVITASTAQRGVDGTATAQQSTATSDTNATESTSDTTDVVDDDVATTTTPAEEESSTITVLDETETTDEEISSSDEAESTEAETELETVSDDANMVDVLEVATISDHNYFQFSKSQCSQVADGSFYCFNGQRTELTTSPTEDGVFSLLGAYGYLDIALVRDGDVEFITSNRSDDSAPMYDEISNTVVWHRMIDDRYVIMSYDFKTKEETQLTAGKTNDMQPVRSGAVTAWQRWVGGTWQIVMLRGEVETQLSNTVFPSVGPSINGDFILWNTTNATGDKQVVVYELSTGRSNIIDDDEGGFVSNPRFVLVYDTQLDNGDTITKGFDPLTGEVIPLAAVPTERPNLPSPDPSGETRALINNKSGTGREDYDEIDPFDPDSFTPGTTTTNLASTTNSADSGVLEVVATTSEPMIPIELTEYDLVVVPFEVEATTTADETVQ